MTGEVKADGRRKRFHQRSKSSIGDYTSPIHLDPIKDVVQMKESPNAGRKDHSRSWFKSKKPSQLNPEGTSDLEVEDLKPLQLHRIVQGLYRDDDGGPSPKILIISHSAARDAVKEFAKDFVAQMKAGDPEESLAMESQMRQHLQLTGSSPPTVDLKYVAQAYIAHQFFTDFENASFGIPNPGEKPWEVQDHMRRCFAQFQKFKMTFQTVSKLLENESNEWSFLSQFCIKKFRTIVPSGAFIGGDYRHHLKLEKGHHPDTPFYRSFLGAAVSVWLLQRLAFSFEQKIVSIIPTKGDAFQRRFMAPVVPGTGDSDGEENDGDLEIAFTVFPGFRVSESVVESLVYVVGGPTVLPKMDMPTFSSGVEPPVETAQKSLKGGEHSLLQKIRSKFTRKKTLVKGTAVAENPATVTSAPPLEEQEPSREEAAPSLEESTPSMGEAAPPLEAPAPSMGEPATPLREPAPSRAEPPPSREEEPSPPTDVYAEQNTTSVMNPASESSSPRVHPLNTEVTDSYVPPSNPYSLGVDNDNRLYIPRAEKSMLMQSPSRSPRLSSVD